MAWLIDNDIRIRRHTKVHQSGTNERHSSVSKHDPIVVIPTQICVATCYKNLGRIKAVYSYACRTTRLSRIFLYSDASKRKDDVTATVALLDRWSYDPAISPFEGTANQSSMLGTFISTIPTLSMTELLRADA